MKRSPLDGSATNVPRMGDDLARGAQCLDVRFGQRVACIWRKS